MQHFKVLASGPKNCKSARFGTRCRKYLRSCRKKLFITIMLCLYGGGHIYKQCACWKIGLYALRTFTSRSGTCMNRTILGSYVPANIMECTHTTDEKSEFNITPFHLCSVSIFNIVSTFLSHKGTVAIIIPLRLAYYEYNNGLLHISCRRFTPLLLKN